LQIVEEEWKWWRKMKLKETADLANVTHFKVPFNIFSQHRPPETIQKSSSDGKETAMSKVIVSLN
jgi:hypothetical protein